MMADELAENVEELSDKRLANLYLRLAGAAYDRKLTEEVMEELVRD